MIVAEGEYVMIHGRYTGWGPKPMVAVDIFRVVGGKLVEHWDVMQEEVRAELTKLARFDVSHGSLAAAARSSWDVRFTTESCRDTHRPARQLRATSRTSGDFIDRHFARDALERRALRARGDAGILQQRRRLRIVDDRLAGEDRV
jgi:hypothetical protein